MTKQEYEDFQAAVTEFLAAEGITSISSGVYRCPECSEHPVMDNDGNYPVCPSCGYEHIGEPFFSWSPCDCCGDSLGGNREHATAYNKTTKEIQEYVICEDCVYYAEYGRLDDQTMDEIEEDDTCPNCGEDMDKDCNGLLRCPDCDGPCPGCSDGG